jgi:hypothetical protein
MSDQEPKDAGQPPRELRVPGDLQPDPDGRMVWWKPGLADILKRIGYGWLYLLALAFVAMLALAAAEAGVLLTVGIWGCYAWVGLAGMAVGIIGRAVQLATRARPDLFCIHCGYSLEGLPDHYRCPECGRPYSIELIIQYREDPAWFVRRWRMQRQTGFHASAGPIEAGKRRRKSKDGT